MGYYRLMARTNPVAGKEEEFRTWYSETHLRDVLAVPGMKSAQFFEIHDSPASSPSSHRYLAIYEMETDDVDGMIDELRRRRSGGVMTMSDSLDLETASLNVYELASPLLRSE